MTPLRQRMQEDLVLHNYTVRTQTAYLRDVASFAKHFGSSPDRLDFEQVRAYLLGLIRSGVSFGYYNQVRCALHFFYTVTLQRTWPDLQLVCARAPSRLPEILARSEVGDLLKAASNVKHHTLLATLYATGVRAFELLQLQIPHIDSRRMVLHIFGKGQKERLVPLSAELLQLLRDYWKQYRPQPYLFPGTRGVRGVKPMRYGSLLQLCHDTADKAGLAKSVSPHLLRHTYATHLYENGVDVTKLQVLLGHAKLSTTMRYVRVALPAICATQSPFNLLAPLMNPTTPAPTTTATLGGQS